MSADLVRKLSALGLNLEQVAGVMEIFDADTEQRKSKARERVQRWRDKHRNVTETRRNVTVGLTRVEDSSSNSKISEKEKKEDTSPSARSRGTRIPDDFVPSIEWAISQGLSLSQAQFEAAQFIDFWRGKPGKDGLKLDWPGTWRMWVRNAIKRSTGPPKKRSYVDVAIDKFTGQANGTESVFGGNGDAQRISARLIESRPDDAHLRGGIGGRFRPSDS
jgi:hypothetical protein